MRSKLQQNNLFLVVDPQNDFIQPTGTLSISGGAEDIEKIIKLINTGAFKSVLVTLDTHHPVHIATTGYWVDKSGANPAPFTVVNSKDLESGKYVPLYHKDDALPYIKSLEEAGKVHVLWPAHCLYATEGWAIYPPLHAAILDKVMKDGLKFITYTKGEHSEKSEMFSVVMPEVSLDKANDEIRANEFLSLLEGYDNIFVAGEAADYCLKESVSDIIAKRPSIVNKLVILKDCMSEINVGNPETKQFWNRVEKQGATIATSKDFL